MGVTAEATRSESIAISIDHPQFTAQIRAGEPAALQSVVHAYLDQILRAAFCAKVLPKDPRLFSLPGRRDWPIWLS